MGWDNVPWMIGGGAEHSTNVARNVAFAAFGGTEGIVSPKDLQVRALAVPGSSVRIAPGTVAIQNRASGARDEMYVARLPAEDTIGISSTGGLGRSDLIVARVENPNEGESWPAPGDVKSGPYVFTRVIPGVPNTTTTAAQLGLGHSMVALARVDVPASTATITQAMVTDLRSMSAIRAKREFGQGGSGSGNLTNTINTYTNWPPNAVTTCVIPDWATHMRAVGLVSGVVASGTVQITCGTQFNYAVSGQSPLNIGANAWATDNTAGAERITFSCGHDDYPIPVGMRGKAVTIRLQTQRITNSSATTISASGAFVIDVEFVSKPESN